MNQRHRLGAAALAVVCALFLPGCEFDKYEPEVVRGERWTTGEPLRLPIIGIDGDRADHLVAACGETSVMTFDGQGWSSDAKGYWALLWLYMDRIRFVHYDAGRTVVSGYDGELAIHDGDGWEELSPLPYFLESVRFDHEDRLWVCGYDENMDGVVACWDGVSWRFLPRLPMSSRLFDLEVLGPDHVVADGRNGNVFRYRDGSWSWISRTHEVTQLWADAQGGLLAVEYEGLLELVGDELVPLEMPAFPYGLACLDGRDDGTLVVGGVDGFVAVREAGVWRQIPMQMEELGSIYQTIVRVRLLDDGQIMAQTGGGGFSNVSVFLWDGQQWRSVAAPTPHVNGFTSPVDGDVLACGDEGAIARVGTSPLKMAITDYLENRYRIVDGCEIGSRRLFVTAGGHAIAVNGSQHIVTPNLPGRGFRAVASYPDGAEPEAVAVGEEGLAAWGINGLQYVDELAVTADLQDIWTPDGAVWWVVGDGGTVLRREERTWTVVEGVATVDLLGIWGRSPRDFYVTGDGGTVLASDGDTWTDLACPLEQDLLAVGGTGGRYLWVCGRGGALAYHDGSAWTVVDTPDGEDLVDLVVDNYRKVQLLTADNRLLEYTIINP